MKLKTIRVTALSLYESCPGCFFLSISGVKHPVIEAFQLGKKVHKAIEEYHLFKKNVFSDEIAPFMKPYIDQYDPHYQEVEYRFSLPLFDTGIVLTGTIDLIRDNWIFEHKTSSARYTIQEVDNHKQVTAYAWAYRQIFKKDPTGIRFNVLVKNKVPVLQCMETYRTDADYDNWKEWVVSILDGIKNDKFDPKPSRFHIYSICPANL